MIAFHTALQWSPSTQHYINWTNVAHYSMRRTNQQHKITMAMAMTMITTPATTPPTTIYTELQSSCGGGSLLLSPKLVAFSQIVFWTEVQSTETFPLHLQQFDTNYGITLQQCDTNHGSTSSILLLTMYVINIKCNYWRTHAYKNDSQL